MASLKLLFRKKDKIEHPEINNDLNKFKITGDNKKIVQSKMTELIISEKFKKTGNYIVYVEQVNHGVNYSSRSILFGPHIIALHIFDELFNHLKTYLFKKENVGDYKLMNDGYHYYISSNSKYNRLKFDNYADKITYKFLAETYFNNEFLQLSIDEITTAYKKSDSSFVKESTISDVLTKAILYEINSVKNCQCYSIGPFIVGKKYSSNLRYDFDYNFIIDKSTNNLEKFSSIHYLEKVFSKKVLDYFKTDGDWEAFDEYRKNPLVTEHKIIDEKYVSDKSQILSAILYEISRFNQEKINHKLLSDANIDTKKKFYDYLKLKDTLELEPGRYATLDWYNETNKQFVEEFFDGGYEIDF